MMSESGPYVEVHEALSGRVRHRQPKRGPLVTPFMVVTWLCFWVATAAGVVWRVTARRQPPLPPPVDLEPLPPTESVVERTMYYPPDTFKVPVPQNNTKGPYRSAQFLGFNIQTGYAQTDVRDLKRYLGIAEVDRDIAGRFKVLEEALDNAYASPHWDRSPTTLKVFMAPEFFFRGPFGAYHVGPILKGSLHLGQLLERLFRQERWADWLFIPGTIVAAEPAGDRNNQTYLYFNVAPIYQGATTKKWLHFKETIGTIDFLQMNNTDTVDVIPFPATRRYSELPPWMARHLNRSGYRSVRNNKFTMAGLSIGIEICADHGGATLAGRQNGTVHLQLITSGGMSIAKGPVVVPAGGPIFLVDGFGRTEISRNLYGMGLMYAEHAEQGKDLYNVGPVHWAGLYSSLRNWLAVVVRDLTGSSGSTPTGFTTSEFLHLTHRIDALGPDWRANMDRLFVTEPYVMVTRAYEALRAGMEPLWKEHNGRRRPLPPKPATVPTVDCYAPLPLVELQPRRMPNGDLLEPLPASSA